MSLLIQGVSSESPERMIFIRGGAPQGACVLQFFLTCALQAGHLKRRMALVGLQPTNAILLFEQDFALRIMYRNLRILET
jgi:hypothetical protein